MAKPSTGELVPLRDGRFAARITIEGKRRPQFVLTTCTKEPDAEARKTAMADLASRLRRAGLVGEIEKLMTMAAVARPGKPWENIVGAVDALCAGGTEEVRASVIPTFKDFAAEWTSGKLHTRFPDHVASKDASDDKSRLRNYVDEYLGDRRLDQITLADCDHVMANLPEELEASSRRHVAQVIGRVMKLAVYPGRHIATNPIPRGWLPRPGKGKARGYIYPDEDAKLLAKTEVPLWRRLLWGFMAREGTRGPSEALSFRWRHIDLERGAVRLDANKTDDPRVWSLTPGTARALRAWKKRTIRSAPTDPIFVDEHGRGLDTTRLADIFRTDLRLALGADARPELFEHDEHRIMLRAHDLRASFITVALANGRSETWVTDRTGHTTSGQLVNYRRAARTVAELELGDFKPLDEAVPELQPSPVDAPSGGPTPPHSGQVDRTKGHDLPVPAETASGAPFLGSAAARRGGSSPFPCTSEDLGDDAPAREQAPPGNQRGIAGTTPRGAAIASMFEHAARLATAGDLAGARALHVAIGAMLGVDGGQDAAVVDLRARRQRGEPAR